MLITDPVIVLHKHDEYSHVGIEEGEFNLCLPTMLCTQGHVRLTKTHQVLLC